MPPVRLAPGARAASWGLVVVGTVVLALVLEVARVPSATLFAALLVGLVASLVDLPQRLTRARDRRAPASSAHSSAHSSAPDTDTDTRAPGAEDGPPDGLRLPRWAATVGQVGIGVLAGSYVRPSTITTLAADWAPISGAVASSLLVSVLAGLAFGRHPRVDAVTGSFALVAGGASGLTAISRELGADQRVVAVVQYLRVLVTVVSMPAVAALLPVGTGSAGAAGTAATTAGAGPGWPAGLALTVGAGTVGWAAARALRVPAASLLGPMVAVAVLSATGVAHGATVPSPLLQVAYALIGAQVGLSFTRQSLLTVRAVLPAAMGCVLALMVVTAALGIPLLHLAGASTLDGYLATAPGGLYAALATAAATGADTALVLTVQVLRLLVMLLLAPPLAVALGRRRGAGRAGHGPERSTR